MAQYPLYLPMDLIKQIDQAEIDNFSGLIQSLLRDWFKETKTKELSDEEKKEALKQKKQEMFNKLTAEIEEIDQKILGIDREKQLEDEELQEIIDKRKKREQEHEEQFNKAKKKLSKELKREVTDKEVNKYIFNLRQQESHNKFLSTLNDEEPLIKLKTK